MPGPFYPRIRRHYNSSGEEFVCFNTNIDDVYLTITCNNISYPVQYDYYYYEHIYSYCTTLPVGECIIDCSEMVTSNEEVELGVIIDGEPAYSLVFNETNTIEEIYITGSEEIQCKNGLTSLSLFCINLRKSYNYEIGLIFGLSDGGVNGGIMIDQVDLFPLWFHYCLPNGMYSLSYYNIPDCSIFEGGEEKYISHGEVEPSIPITTANITAKIENVTTYSLYSTSDCNDIPSTTVSLSIVHSCNSPTLTVFNLSSYQLLQYIVIRNSLLYVTKLIISDLPNLREIYFGDYDSVVSNEQSMLILSDITMDYGYSYFYSDNFHFVSLTSNRLLCKHNI